MNHKESKDKSTIELIADTAKDGVLAGVKLEVGTIIAVATLATETRTLESGYKNAKDSLEGCYEIGKRIGESIAKSEKRRKTSS